MPDDTALGGLKTKGNWDKNKKLYVGLGVAGLVLTYYLYQKSKSSGGSAVTSASPAIGSSASSAYAAGAQAQAAQDQQFVASLQSMGAGGSGTGATSNPWGQSIGPGGYFIPGSTGTPGSPSTGTPGSPSTGTPGSPSTGTPSTSSTPQYTGIQDPFWGQQGVAVPQSLTPGTAIYIHNPTTGAYQFGGTYQPTAQNEYNIQGLPSAQALQAAGFSTGLYTAG